MTLPCPICNINLKRHKRKAGPYRVYICPSCKDANGQNMEFFVNDSGLNYDCKRFEECALKGKMKCKSCEVKK